MNVNSWFNNYVKDNINISKNTNSNGKRSRDWLISNIKNISTNNGFPKLYGSNVNEYSINMGSYARKTQVKPLDDIDQMIVFSANNSFANWDTGDWNNIQINVPDSATDLINFVGFNGLSSIKFMNYLKTHLKEINQYKSAEIKRNEQVIRLELISYDWGFDIVPGFRTTNDDSGKYYFLIPNGKGVWQKTNPIIDRNNLDSYQSNYTINIREVIRILKYWKSKHNYVSSINSYLIETLVLDFLDENDCLDITNSRIFIQKFLLYAFNAITMPVYDRKNIQGNINKFKFSEKSNVRSVIKKYIDVTKLANCYEQLNDYDSSIREWNNFFGE